MKNVQVEGKAEREEEERRLRNYAKQKYNSLLRIHSPIKFDIKIEIIQLKLIQKCDMTCLKSLELQTVKTWGY